MELKTNYQYTYFVHPFVIGEGKYQKYILNLIKDDRFKLRVFEKNKYIDLYNYFSPKTREYLFSSFSHTPLNCSNTSGITSANCSIF